MARLAIMMVALIGLIFFAVFGLSDDKYLNGTVVSFFAAVQMSCMWDKLKAIWKTDDRFGPFFRILTEAAYFFNIFGGLWSLAKYLKVIG